MKSVLFVLGGGIGNIVQATPAIKAAHAEGWTIDLLLHCNSSTDIKNIFSIPQVRRVYVGEQPKESYEWQCRGPFTPGKLFKAKKHCRPRLNYAQHLAEAEIYYDLVKQMGVKEKMGRIEVNVGRSGPRPERPGHTIAIYPGSKHNWAMKRWDKYDELAHQLGNVVIVGGDKDIYSNGEPAWFQKKWDWPKDAKIQMGSLQETAHLISHCKAFIGNDGGLAHVAAATGVPTCVLFGPSSVAKNKPYAPNAHAISIDIPCRPCQFKKDENGKEIFGGNKASCPYNMQCMREMSVDYVLKKVRHVIKARSKK